jgi:uncharacterized protein DUF4337
MNPEEMKEVAEHAHNKGEKGIGLTMAVVAVLLAVATLLGHRTHTEEGLLQGKIVDEWNFYQAKHGRAHEYGALAEIAALLPHAKARDLAMKNYKKSLEEECGTPPEHGCSSPAKDSAIIQELLGGAKKDSANHEGGSDPAAGHEEAGAGKDKGEGGGGKAEAPAGKGEAKSSAPKAGAVKIQDTAREMEHEREIIERRADFYDSAELFLEISIVLCSIALLAEVKIFWQLSFITTIIGVGIIVWGLVGVH